MARGLAGRQADGREWLQAWSRGDLDDLVVCTQILHNALHAIVTLPPLLIKDENVDPNSSGGTAAVLCGQKEMTVELTALLKERGVDAILLNF